MRMLVLAGLVCACQDNVGSIVFKPSYQPPLPATTCADDPRKPATMHVTLTADGDTYQQTVNFAADVVQLDIPIGTMRNISIELLDKYNCKLYSGSRGPISFAEGDNGTLVVTMRPPSASGDYVDGDHDGLPLCVEKALMTKDNAADTDGDGYSDFCEVTGLAGSCSNPTKSSSKPSGPSSRCSTTTVDGGID